MLLQEAKSSLKKRKLHRFLISMTANVAFEISDDMNFELITEKQKV